MFIHYAAQDAALQARIQKASKSQRKSAKKLDLWTETRGANAGVAISKTISAHEFSEVSEHIGALPSQCFALGFWMSDSAVRIESAYHPAACVTGRHFCPLSNPQFMQDTSLVSKKGGPTRCFPSRSWHHRDGLGVMMSP